MDGKIWVGTSGNNIAQFDGGSWSTLSTSLTDIRDIEIANYHITGQEAMFVATYGMGLARYDINGSSWNSTLNSSNSDLPSNYIVDIEVDAYDNVWIATNSGLAVYSHFNLNGFPAINNASISTPDADLCPAEVGEFFVIITGGTAPYTVTLSNGNTYTNYQNGDTLYSFSSPAITITSVQDQIGNTSSTNTGSVTFVQHNLPIISAGSDQSMCDGDTTTLTATGNATSYSWSNSVVDGVAFVQPVGSTNYTLTGTNTAGCSTTDVVQVTVNSIPNVIAASNKLDFCLGDTLTLTAIGATSYNWNNGLGSGQSHNLMPTTNTTYYVTGETLGCAEVDSVSITMLPEPTVNAGIDTAVCESENVTLSGSGTDMYSWDNSVTDGVPFSTTLTTTYTVIGTDSTTGCTNTDDVTITVNQLPNVSITNNTGDLCKGDSTFVYIPNISGGVFSGDVNAVGEFNQDTALGTYNFTYEITDNSGCKGSLSETFNLIDCTVEAINDDLEMISIYPNPATSILHIDIKMNIKNVMFFNALGEMLLQSNQKNVDVSQLKTGMYIIKINTETENYSLPIIIK